MEKESKIQLENIVYYRGETHYFVMTALRASLIDRGVILEDKDDRKSLMAPSNINRDKLHQVQVHLAFFLLTSNADGAKFATEQHLSVKYPRWRIMLLFAPKIAPSRWPYQLLRTCLLEVL